MVDLKQFVLGDERQPRRGYRLWADAVPKAMEEQLEVADILSLIQEGKLPPEALQQLTGGLTEEEMRAREEERARQFWTPTPDQGFMGMIAQTRPDLAAYGGPTGSKYGRRQMAIQEGASEALAQQMEQMQEIPVEAAANKVDALTEYLQSLGAHGQTMGQMTQGIPEDMLQTPSEAGALTTWGPLLAGAAKWLFPGAGAKLGTAIGKGFSSLLGLTKGAGTAGAGAAAAVPGVAPSAWAALGGAPAGAAAAAPGAAGLGTAATMPWEMSPTLLAKPSAGALGIPGATGLGLAAGAGALAMVPVAKMLGDYFKDKKEERYQEREDRAMRAIANLSDDALANSYLRSQIEYTSGADITDPESASSNTLQRLFSKGKIAELAESRGWSGALANYKNIWEQAKTAGQQRAAYRKQEQSEITQSGVPTRYSMGREAGDMEKRLIDEIRSTMSRVRGGSTAIDWDAGEIDVTAPEEWTPERIGSIEVETPRTGSGRQGGAFQEWLKRAPHSGPLQERKSNIKGYMDYLEEQKRISQRGVQ